MSVVTARLREGAARDSLTTTRLRPWRQWLSALALAIIVGGTPVAAGAICGDGVVDGGCVGDCNGDGSVTVDEIVTMVNIALGMAGDCAAGDADGSGTITVDEIITATNNALNGCPGAAAGDSSGEQCDDGGTCIGGDNAGTACTAEDQCPGNGVCVGGVRVGTLCADDDACPGGSCVRCKTFGGDGCAANCTEEKKITFTLVPGRATPDQQNLVNGTSGVVVFSEFLNIPLPLSGSLRITVGQERNGEIPVVVNEDDIDFPAIPVVTFACACVQGTTPRTCGGVLLLEDGESLSPDCTDNASICTSRGLPPCAPVHGQGNTASGTIGCAGLDGTDILSVLTDGELSVSLDGRGGPGSALLFTSVDIGVVVGQCMGSGAEYGPDGRFCTADDPPNELSAVGTGPTTSGTACGQIINEFGGLGPECRTGAPASCQAVSEGDGSVSGTCITFALPVEDLVEQLGDIVATLTLCAQ